MLLETTSEGIYGMDANGVCTFCNPAAATMLGYANPEALLGKVMHGVMHHTRTDGSGYPQSQCRACQPFGDQQPVHVDDELFWRADGSGFAVEYHANPIRRDGAVVGVVVNFSDITERRRVEAVLSVAHDALQQERTHLADRVRKRTAELDRANTELARSAQAKDEFLAAMSHELRTPLTSILGLSETLEDGLLGPLSKPQARAAHTINESGAHLLDLINDVLDMSRVASGRMVMHWDQVPVNQLWDATLRLIQPAAEARGLRVVTRIDPAVELLSGDSRQLKQMLINLLGNAVKFTPEGGSIGLDVQGDAAARQVRIGVWDTGVGIAKDQQERLFQPFVQLDSRLSRHHDGTGLGLALAFGMAQLHNGTIVLQSEPGEGSRFELQLPWDPDAQRPLPSPDSADRDEGQAGEGELRHPRVLLVDDNHNNREMIAAFLGFKGCQVTMAANGVEAISAAVQRPFDIVLMDVQMPEMDGLEATRRLRERPETAKTPILAVTALAMPGDRERCLEAGMDDYLVKPLGLKALHQILLTWIKRVPTG